MVTDNLSILFDADALVAFAKKDDNNHQKAKELHNKVLTKGADVFISAFSIPEAATVLSYKGSHELAKKFLATIPQAGYTEFSPNEEFNQAAIKWFLKQKKRGTSYFDCFNMGLMELFGFDAIFSFDKIYKQNGFKLVSDLDL